MLKNLVIIVILLPFIVIFKLTYLVYNNKQILVKLQICYVICTLLVLCHYVGSNTTWVMMKEAQLALKAGYLALPD